MENEETCFTTEDLAQLAEHGISLEEAERQLTQLREGITPLCLLGAASLLHGVMEIGPDQMGPYLDLWEEFRRCSDEKICRFVPASGAASRMFRSLYDLLATPGERSIEELDEEQRLFFDNLDRFAFFNALSEVCLRNEWTSAGKLLERGRYDLVTKALLGSNGLGYADKPKGLILFHRAAVGQEPRTAVMEHMAEAALYAKKNNGEVRLHFTVSENHLEAFKQHVERMRPALEEQYGVFFDVQYSTQHSSTDTLSLGADGQPFRTQDGRLLLRPGGHGALLANLACLEEEIIFVKNIDNVAPDFFKGNTIRYKKLLGGVLLALRDKIYGYLRLLDRGRTTKAQLMEMVTFLHDTLSISLPQQELLGDKELADRIFAKLNRPIRVCGVVPNSGEPGGGPYLVQEADGSTSLQILEASQIDLKDERSAEIMRSGRFFNPVDLVLTTKDYQGNHFDLSLFVNERTSFISEKSYDGEPLKALELPGLWNGAMDRWNTLFIAVPADTFSPVKTINDLLRPMHQPPGKR